VKHPILSGVSLLVVEDEPLIAMDIAMAFEECGAHITSTNTLRHAVLLVEHDGLSGAILDHALPDGDSSILCERLKARGVPFMIYSGFEKVGGACAGAPHLSKPATHKMLVAAMVDLICTARLATQQ
jgi:DNA-binding response OmpR family regulator